MYKRTTVTGPDPWVVQRLITWPDSWSWSWPDSLWDSCPGSCPDSWPDSVTVIIIVTRLVTRHVIMTGCSHRNHDRDQTRDRIRSPWSWSWTESWPGTFLCLSINGSLPDSFFGRAPGQDLAPRPLQCTTRHTVVRFILYSNIIKLAF